jgi:hypothetical protein
MVLGGLCFFSSVPETTAQPEPPVEEDEWGGDAAEGSSCPIVIDEWGEPVEPEPEPPSTADSPRPVSDDEWEEHDVASALVPEEEEVDEQAERREELKCCLVNTVCGSELGFWASSEVRGEVVELDTQLEEEAWPLASRRRQALEWGLGGHRGGALGGRTRRDRWRRGRGELRRQKGGGRVWRRDRERGEKYGDMDFDMWTTLCHVSRNHSKNHRGV